MNTSLLSGKKTWGFRFKHKIPDSVLRLGTPKVCTRCGYWFIPGPRERVCFDCLSSTERAKRAVRVSAHVHSNESEKPQVRGGAQSRGETQDKRLSEAGRLEAWNRLCARRTRKLMDWLAADPGRKAKDYGQHGEMSGREVEVAIGWLPWPAPWPGWPTTAVRDDGLRNR